MTKKISILGIGIALYVALGMVVKIPIIGNIQTDLGYIVFGVYLFLFGVPAIVVGVIGCLFESLILNGWVPIGWMLGQMIIAIFLGNMFKLKLKWWEIIIYTCLASFMGIVIAKTITECLLYDIPFSVKVIKNLVAWVCDIVPLNCGVFIAKKYLVKFKWRE